MTAMVPCTEAPPRFGPRALPGRTVTMDYCIVQFGLGSTSSSQEPVPAHYSALRSAAGFIRPRTHRAGTPSSRVVAAATIAGERAYGRPVKEEVH
jgi:hypothetical protein